ncbi:hypothetical protein A2Z22_05365 [Candidatus Woesebacteria bacterium RBG_16_34_12]|uniref:Uncharacterized protein n=1 Tax=Candidatus Woesebacteria bacterium RBG_16_34_12 TaxID=1802480 RepID=A0A1F7X6J3_9BACT|nr:MAG: hypothetical protein A2Z22_05365 [Candidatus Woesebacteria bacterium RBG_16_34_12]
MVHYSLYLSYWLVNSLILYLFNTLYPDDIVLGTYQISYITAIIFSGFWMTFFFWALWDFFKGFKLKIEKIFFALAFLSLLNSISVWSVARLANFTGLGVSSFMWAIIIGSIANFFHLFLWTDYTREKGK